MDFSQVMSQRTDEELIKIVTIQKADYQPEAVKAAESEMSKRGISSERIESIKEEIVLESMKNETMNNGTVSSMIRFIHMIVDFISFFLIAFILSIILDLFLQFQDQAMISTVGFLLFVVSYFSYYIILEYKYNKTLGKLLTKTVVTRRDGKQPILSDIITRTFCRLIPFDQVSFIFTKNGFHDYLSNTTVIKEKN